MSTRPANRFELFTCGWKGHVLVGTDAARVSDADAAVVRQIGGVRWYHCLRCYDWVAQPPPDEPSSDTVPDRREIELPLRGRLLRARYVLRLIACDRAVFSFKTRPAVNTPSMCRSRISPVSRSTPTSAKCAP